MTVYLPVKKVTGFGATARNRRKPKRMEEGTTTKQEETKTDQEDTDNIITDETRTEQESSKIL